jgi:hypothetical protein
MVNLVVEIKNGYTEVIIDDACEFSKFYKTASVLTGLLDYSYTQKLLHHDTAYYDFEYKASKLTLHYNVYLGITVFPTALKKAIAIENEHALEIGSLLHKKLMDIDWYPFDNGNTIGHIGSESGEILIDLENAGGARITLEKECMGIPFAITLGIYGLMMHTHFESNLDDASKYIDQSKIKINKILELYTLDPTKQDNDWQTKLNNMINELAEINLS